MDPQQVLVGTFPLALVLMRLLQLVPGMLACLLRHICDLTTLRMTLRDAAPGQRAELLAAHRAWCTQRVLPATSRQRKPRPDSRPHADV
ncbi:hypothetical protein [Streptomyces phaeochromogenes]|uniref:hypothetical protein n=1 Tax=Streptomyces phaeochromogenes TaxID=1923 RepID=UPI0006E21485|nr:hypothetical protein [Streptomyces phaeochromogenes]